MHRRSLNLLRVSKLSKRTTMSKQHKGYTLISDLKLKYATNVTTLVTWVNETHRFSVLAHGQKTKCVTNDKLLDSLPN